MIEARPSALKPHRLSRKAKKKLKAERMAHEAAEGQVHPPWLTPSDHMTQAKGDSKGKDNQANFRKVFAKGKKQKGKKGKKGIKGSGKGKKK